MNGSISRCDYGLMFCSMLFVIVMLAGALVYVGLNPRSSAPAVHHPNPLLKQPRYAQLRYEAREVCLYNRWIDQNPNEYTGDWQNMSLVWSNRYLADEGRLEARGIPTPSESTMLSLVCPS